MNNLFLQKIKQKQQPVGTFLSFGNADYAECLGLSGLDYFIVDTEHGTKEPESVVDLLRAGELQHCTPLVRIKDSSRAAILKMLDIGAHGLIIPNVTSLEEAQRIVEYGKYAPLGLRGINLPRSASYGAPSAMTSMLDYTQNSNQETLLIPQCETLGCLENIEKITALSGINAIFVGPFDLSQAMGMTAEFERPEFIQALERILAACQQNNVPTIIFAATAEAAKTYLNMGFDSVTVSMDALIFTAAYTRLVEQVRS